MKRSFRGWVSLALVCAMSVSALAVSAVRHVAEMAFATCRAFKSLLVDNFLSLPKPNPLDRAAVVPKVQARAFSTRIEKRERPVVTSSWRMCPSI